MASNEDIRRASTIRAFLEDPVIQEAFEGTRLLLIDRWTRATTVADREAAHATYQGLLELAATLKGLQNAGEYARILLERETAKLI